MELYLILIRRAYLSTINTICVNTKYIQNMILNPYFKYLIRIVFFF